MCFLRVCVCFLRVCVCFLPGDVHVGMVDRGGQLEVEVNQARGLTPKPGSKNIPGTFAVLSNNFISVLARSKANDCYLRLDVIVIDTPSPPTVLVLRRHERCCDVGTITINHCCCHSRVYVMAVACHGGAAASTPFHQKCS